MMDASLRERLARIYVETDTIAVVGASGDPSKPAHRIPRYLQDQGYRIRPVNPRGGELLGETVARSLAEVDGPVDVLVRPESVAVGLSGPERAASAVVVSRRLGATAPSPQVRDPRSAMGHLLTAAIEAIRLCPPGQLVDMDRRP